MWYIIIFLFSEFGLFIFYFFKKKNLDLLFFLFIDEYFGSVFVFVLYMYYFNFFKMFNFLIKGVGKFGVE